MYNKTTLNLTVSILLSMLIFSSNVAAKDCYEKSPNFINLKDKYYDIEDTKTLSDDEKSKLNTLFDKIEGKWEVNQVILNVKAQIEHLEKNLKHLRSQVLLN